MSNLTHVGRTLYPSLINHLETLFATNVDSDRRVRDPRALFLFLVARLITSQTSMTIVTEMDKILFDYYIKQKSSALNKIVHDGILNSGIDWYDTPRPTGSSCSPSMARTRLNICQKYELTCTTCCYSSSGYTPRSTA